jgi:cytochrome b pre-mRNA-processing protein 3
MLALLKNLFAAPASSAAQSTYIALVAQARNEFFYETLGVPDTLDGRFELILLHLFLLQNRLLMDGANQQSEDFSRDLVEMFFADMDSSVREIGVSDSGVRYRIKAMAKAYHGRLQVYSAAISDPETLHTALARNLYGTLENGDPNLLTRMGNYVTATAKSLSAIPTASIILAGRRWLKLRLPLHAQ